MLYLYSVLCSVAVSTPRPTSPTTSILTPTICPCIHILAPTRITDIRLPLPYYSYLGLAAHRRAILTVLYLIVFPPDRLDSQILRLLPVLCSPSQHELSCESPRRAAQVSCDTARNAMPCHFPPAPQFENICLIEFRERAIES